MINRTKSKKLFLISFIVLGLIIAASTLKPTHNSTDLNTPLEDLRTEIGRECNKKTFSEDCDEGLNAVGKEQLNKNADVASKQDDKLIITLENGEKKIFQDKSADPKDETDVGTYYFYDYFFRDLGFHAIRENAGGCSSGDAMLINSKTGESTPISSHYYYWQFSPDGKNFLVYTCGGIQIWEISLHKLKLKYEDHDSDCENGLKKAKWVNNQEIELLDYPAAKGKIGREISLKLKDGAWVKTESNIESAYKGTPIISPDKTRIIANNIGMSGDQKLAIYKILNPNKYAVEKHISPGKNFSVVWENNRRIAINHENTSSLKNLDVVLNLDNGIWESHNKGVPKDAVFSPDSKRFIAIDQSLSIFKIIEGTDNAEYHLEYHNPTSSIISSQWIDDNKVRMCFESTNEPCVDVKYDDTKWNQVISADDPQEGKEIDGWKIEKSVRNEMVGGMIYDSYLVLKGKLKTTVKYYNSHSDMSGNDFRVYFSEDVLKSMPVKNLEGGINIVFRNEKLPHPLSDGSYGTMEVVIDSIRIISVGSDADTDCVYASEVISINEKGSVAGPYTDRDEKRYDMQNKEAEEFIKSAPFTINNTPASALHSAAQSGNKTEVGKLLKEGANINAVDGFGDTPLLIAITNNKVDVAEILLENNANINLANHLKETPLHIAVKNKESEIVKTLLKKGADIQAANSEGNTPLYNAVKTDQLDIITLLINAGAKITAKNISERTPLYYAKNFEVVKLLITSGSKFSELGDKGFEILSFAIGKKDKEFVKFLMENGIDINLKREQDSKSVLHFIEQKDNFDFIKFLFDNGLDVNIQDSLGKTALHEAAWMSITEKYVEFLLENKANPNIQDNKGATPLHSSAFFMQIPNIKLLLNYAADTSIKDQGGKTAINVIEEKMVSSKEDKNKQAALLLLLNKTNGK